jgi:hypothetical protein
VITLERDKQNTLCDDLQSKAELIRCAAEPSNAEVLHSLQAPAIIGNAV